MRWSTTATTTTTAMIEEGERNKSKTARKQGKGDQYTAGRLTGKKKRGKNCLDAEEGRQVHLE
jgi:hypothetical protein